MDVQPEGPDHEYVPPPDPFNCTDGPAHVIVLLEPALAVGVATTVMVWVYGVEDPFALLAINEAVYVPAVLQVTVGFCNVEVLGVPP